MYVELDHMVLQDPPAMDQGGHFTSGDITVEHSATYLYLPIVYTAIEPVSTKP